MDKSPTIVFFWPLPDISGEPKWILSDSPPGPGDAKGPSLKSSSFKNVTASVSLFSQLILCRVVYPDFC